MHNWKYKINRFLNDYAPVLCWVCHGLFFNKDVTYETNTIGQVVPLCRKCHNTLYRPFWKE